MVKGVIGEESRLQLAEDRLSSSRKPVEIGLVIGKFSHQLDRGFIYYLIPTPPNDAGESPCSLNSPVVNKTSKLTKSSSSTSAAATACLFIDQDWVSEHARQVCRMMVGGIQVIGIFVWASETAFKNSTLLLSQTVKGVAGAAPTSVNNSDERLVVHISYSPRRWTCRTSNIASSNLHPCDLKMGRILNSLRAFRCMYELNLRLPICTENFPDTRTLSHLLQDVISSHAKELAGANALIDGDLANLSEDATYTSDALHEIELLFPFMKDGSLEASSRKEVLGMVVFSGTICSYSYLNAKEPVLQVLADIKEDIIMSLKSRLDMITDEAERELTAPLRDGSETNSEVSVTNSAYQNILKPLTKEFILPFPRRVLIPWLSGLYVCDYLLPSETFEALKEHSLELLSMEVPTNASFLEWEKEFPRLTTRSFWHVAAPSHRLSDSALISSKSKREAMKSDVKTISVGNVNGMFAGITLLVAIILGLLLYAWNPVKQASNAP